MTANAFFVIFSLNFAQWTKFCSSPFLVLCPLVHVEQIDGGSDVVSLQFNVWVHFYRPKLLGEATPQNQSHALTSAKHVNQIRKKTFL